jgi:hypothetical protein
MKSRHPVNFEARRFDLAHHETNDLLSHQWRIRDVRVRRRISFWCAAVFQMGNGVAGTFSLSVLSAASSRSGFPEAWQHRGHLVHICRRYFGVLVTHLRRAVVVFKNIAFGLTFFGRGQTARWTGRRQRESKDEE